ncbi:MAG: hypothetical protein KAK00_09910 [Nanoarchaeota archaeon]|nr:hypothetical protein [Nanoarchaeota archaeon]
MRSIFLGILLVAILVLAGCSSQTVVKYQCADGSFADSCSAVECQTNCPELDCASCPPKIEYQTKEIEKEIPVEKIKVVCLDGSAKDKINDCPDIQNLKPSSLDYSGDKCSKEENKDVTEVYVGKLDVNTKKFDRDNIKWYPSLNEGYVLEANLESKNIGCTKPIIKFDAYLLKENTIVSEMKDIYGSIYAPEGVYPGKDVTIGLIYFRTDFGGEGALEFNEPGEYVLRVVLNQIEGKQKNPLAVREDKFIIS